MKYYRLYICSKLGMPYNRLEVLIAESNNFGDFSILLAQLDRFESEWRVTADHETVLSTFSVHT